MNNICFVIMPYGQKKDIDGTEIDFDEIYEYIIKEAVDSLDGFVCIRWDDIGQPGWVHERMLKHIFEGRVVIVDTSTLNPNVFYALGIRHALRKSVTVLIHREGTSWPFNIAGFLSIGYSTNLRGVQEAKEKICNFINNALKDPENIDSPVYHVLPDLRVESGPGNGTRVPKPLTKVEVFEYPLVRNPERRIALITGDREHIKVGDVWVNSENTNMQMDRDYGLSTSAIIRYLGATKDAISGTVIEDTIADELAKIMGTNIEVAPATVLSTGAGKLRKNNVKWIFHVASVIGQPGEGYRPIERIERCVTNALARADADECRDDGLTSILFPIFGAGTARGELKEHAERCINAAVDYLESTPGSSMQVVYFYTRTDVDLEICQDIAKKHPGLKRQ